MQRHLNLRIEEWATPFSYTPLHHNHPEKSQQPLCRGTVLCHSYKRCQLAQVSQIPPAAKPTRSVVSHCRPT